jgi:putative acetyltransferase
MAVTIRKIAAEDNAATAEMIRTILREFKIDRPGTVYTDPTTDHLSTVFEHPQSAYWLAEEDGVIVGGCGIYPTEGLPVGCVELVKLYTSAASRGKGFGKMLMEKSIESAQHFGYNEIYLESFPELTTAIAMYEKTGFKRLSAPLGNSGHFACNVWMLLVL